MKKLLSTACLFLILILLVSCSEKTEFTKPLTKEGIAPYELSQKDEALLQLFGLDNASSQIISFRAPKEAVSLQVHVYQLENGNTWKDVGAGAISLGADRNPADSLTGVFSMQLKENYRVDYRIHTDEGGTAAYTTDEIQIEKETLASTKIFLQEYQAIEINAEIPVSLMVYDSGTRMESHSLQDYFEPSKFEEMDLVQVITLEFSDS